MQADVIDYDELLSGERREGHYIGIWSITRKLAAAFGVGVAFAILGYAGYEPNAEQSATVQVTLRILYCLAPCVCNLLAFIILLTYPLTRAVHEEIRVAISERHAGRVVYDPLNPHRSIA
jgi:GPH family glycoside/pentoside/hexuronide:cation symporter